MSQEAPTYPADDPIELLADAGYDADAMHVVDEADLADSEDRLDAALDAWRTELGPDRVEVSTEVLAQRSLDTSGEGRAPVAVLLPRSREDVQVAVRIAAAHGVPLHPVSTGRNWGYGTATTPLPGTVLLDLGGLRGIAVDDLGIATLEPGVTQGMLRAWLDERGLDLMVPATGAGPSVSVVANALERGYGITPETDHAAAVLSLEAVLPDGSLYRSPLRSYAGAAGFRWGLGPYLDGLFSQGTAGVVTSMSIGLVTRPETIQACYFWVREEADLERAAEAVRRIRQRAGSTVGAVNLMSAMRLLATSQPYPDLPSGEVLTEVRARELAAANGLADWMGVASLYGTRRHVAATRALIRRELRGTASRVLFLSAPAARRLARATALVPPLAGTSRSLRVMARAIDLMRGDPDEATLPLAYWKTRRPLPPSPLDPARDGAGILWYSPVVAVDPGQVRRYVTHVRTTCAEFGFEAPVTLTTVSERTFDSTLPILFDARDVEEARRAEECWEALLVRGRALGFHPYRIAPRHARLVVDDAPYWQLLARVTTALDPDGVISPGRWVTS